MRTTDTPSRSPSLDLPERLGAVAVRPGDRRYDSVRHTYTRPGSPGAVLLVRSAGDIAAALAHARATQVPLTARSGGHGISGRSTNDGGIVVDLSRLNAVEVLDSRSALVRAEAGARWGEVAAALAPYGLALSSGDTGDVGVGGLATAGGIGLMSRLHGLTIDHMSAAELVLADGSVVRTDVEHDPDLFWAVRGAGANFGVATAFEFQAEPVRDVTVAVTVHDAADTAAFLTRWGAAVEAAPRAVTSFLTLVTGAGGRAVAQAMTVYAGTDATAVRTALAPLLSAGRVLRNQAFATPYHQLLPAGHEPQHAQQPLSVSRSGLVDHITPPAAEHITALLETAGMVQLRSVGGAVNDAPPEAMAYSHRTQNFSLMAATVPTLRDDLDQRWERLHPHLNGLYLSFETRTGRQQLEDAFPGAVLERLIALKSHYDPDHLFDNNFALPSVRFPH
ncbi:FAD-binding oxidoreductase [Streptomyces mirabilis]|uniref:FAD-binding oxidoreductase n=1 Tax=Streptomyces mirabilis TaxID=68239 RepID=UPI001BAF56B0|nr:FAD-binding oxidoreductase [Streptomyces mirabilis]QUW83945.1 FAD-binding oxidoreductase [Streptomyces mirabilis]